MMSGVTPRLGAKQSKTRLKKLKTPLIAEIFKQSLD